MNLKEKKIAIIGLGYVGLPLAVEFGKHFKVIGFDINPKRVIELKNFIDVTKEVEENQFKLSTNLNFSDSIEDLKSCNVYIITVPTPIDKFKAPDLIPLLKATEMVGKILKREI
jgi:UDP-N-acetyl-D-galactosamine dehydrogenase